MTFFETVTLNLGILMLLFAILFNAKGSVPLRSKGNSLFLAMVHLAIATTFLWTMSYAISFVTIFKQITYYISVFLNVLLNGLTIAFYHISLLYFYKTLTHSKALSRRANMLFYIPLAVLELMCIANVFMPVSFGIELMPLHHTRMPLYFALLFYAFVCVVLLIHYLCTVESTQKSYLFFTTLLFLFPIIASSVIAFAFSNVNIEPLGIAIALTSAYINIQSKFYGRDQLSGLLTRNHLISHIERELPVKNRRNTYHVGIMLDIDRFKEINDVFGHLAGDAAIRTMGSAILSTLPPNAFAFRYAGDEFVIILEVSDNDEIINFIKKLRFFIGVISSNRALSYPINFSYGFALYDPKRDSVDSFLSRMDSNMYEDKRCKKKDGTPVERDGNAYDQFFSKMHISDIENALSSGEFEVWFQPQLSHEKKKLVSAEALVRWNHPEIGMIPPSSFIPVFERNGFVFNLDKFVWNTVCKTMSEWIKKGIDPVPVYVNVSRIDMLHGDLIAEICKLVNAYRIPKDLFRIEITESALSASAHVVDCANEFIRKGFHVAIDDFGSGYSSLSLLKDIPAHSLKLDIRFFDRTDNSEREYCIIDSVIHMANRLNMSVVAEGVESAENADRLTELGCHCIQGFLYSKPLTTKDYEKFMTKNA